MDTALSVDRDVLAAQPFIYAEMLATRGKGELSGVAIKGVDPELVHDVLDLDRHMIPPGTVDSLADEPAAGEPPPIIIGKQLAYKLKAKVGDDVTVVVPLSTFDFEHWQQQANAPRTRRFRVAGIFYAGFDEFDRRFMYMSLHQAQLLEGLGDEVVGVELKVKDVSRAEAIASELQKALGTQHRWSRTAYEMNCNMFTALEAPEARAG